MDSIQLISALLVITAILFCWRDFYQIFVAKLLNDKSFQHFAFLLMLGLFFLWSAQASVKEGLSIHFLAMTSFTLIFGWRSAFMLTLPVIAGLAITGQIPVETLASYTLLTSLLPILISYSVFAASYRYLPHNIFIYIFIAGFFNGGFTGSMHLLLNTGFQVVHGLHDWQTINDNYFIFLPLLAFPEGLINGMAAAMMSVFKPEWLRTFSDRDYIYQRGKK